MIFQLTTNDSEKKALLTIYLPEGKTMAEINGEAKQELNQFLTKMHGYDVYVTGRCTTALSMMLGHELAHITRSVSIYDPKQTEYVLVIKH